MGEVKGREILISIAIIVVMLILGAIIGNAITNNAEDRNAEVYKAIQIENDPELFQYGMRTNVGSAFAYGTLTSNDNVADSRIDGKRSYIEVTHERYQEHTRIVTKSSGSGENYKEWTEVETYWSWDYVGEDNYSCSSYDFLGVNYPESKINVFTSANYEGTFGTGFHTRDIIYSLPTSFEGTLHTDLADNIPDRSVFYVNNTIEETVDRLTFNWIWFFWVFWLILTGGIVYAFVMCENYWLD